MPGEPVGELMPLCLLVAEARPEPLRNNLTVSRMRLGVPQTFYDVEKNAPPSF